MNSHSDHDDSDSKKPTHIFEPNQDKNNNRSRISNLSEITLHNTYLKSKLLEEIRKTEEYPNLEKGKLEGFFRQEKYQGNKYLNEDIKKLKDT